MTSRFEESIEKHYLCCGPAVEGEVDEAVRKHAPELKETVDRNSYVRNVLKIIREFGDFTLPHSLKVARYCFELGKNLELNPFQLEKFVSAGLVHDLGKVFVSPEILQKNSAMNKSEAEMMHEHVRNSFRLIQEKDPYVAEIIVRHHEGKIDNRYPRSDDRRKNIDASWSGEERRHGERRKNNREIDSLARCLAIIDEFESLTSPDRHYRKPLDMNSAKDQNELREIFQKDYPLPEDEEIVEKLIQINSYLEKHFLQAA